MRILPFILGAALSAAPAGLAQVSVEVVLDQDQFLRDEALPAQVRITNRSGQTLHLGRDNDWLSFTLERVEGGAVSKLAEAPVQGEFDLESANVAKRQVNLTPCFDLEQPGRYQVTATVKIKEWNQELSSKPRPFEVVRGTKLWEEEFGVPTDGGVPEARKYILQQANYRKQLRLYVRICDLTEQRVFRVFPFGPIVSFNHPEAQVDRTGYLHVLFQTGARSFLFCVVSPEGDTVLRQSYDYGATRPTLRPNDEGRIFVGGGVRHLTANDIPPSLTSATEGPVDRPGSAGPTNGASQAPPNKDSAKPKK